MFRRWILGCVGVGGVAVLAYLAVVWRPALPPIDPPSPSSFAPERIATGALLASAGACIDCHTVEGGARGAGGVPIFRLFGTVYSTNITPDPETGIGHWSLAAFTRALREGVARDGKHLFLAFPSDHFTRLTDDDIRALYAYLMTLPRVKAAARADSVPFPLDIRALQAAWWAIYVEPGAYRPDPSHDARWNRGAYLAEAVAHCSACHTPHNLLGAEQIGHPYGGALVDGWWAPPLDVSASPAPWTEAQFIAYLRTGESVPHGVALGTMQKVVRTLRPLPDSDIAAIATYMADVSAPLGPPHAAAPAKTSSAPPPATDANRIEAQLYAARCGACHDTPGATPQSARSPIGLSAALWLEEPDNFVRIVLDGVERGDGVPGPTMPGFRGKLADIEISAIGHYLRQALTTHTSWSDLTISVGRIRASSAARR